MKVFKFLKKFLKSFDLFATNQFFRFRSQQGFQSLFGGVVSILVILGVSYFFYNRIIQCLNKVNIISSSTKVIQADPPFQDMSTYPKGNFMAAIQMQGHNLANMSVRYFDTLLVYTTNEGQNSTTETIFLEPCTSRHWAGVPELKQDLKFQKVSNWMCLPLNMTLGVGGKVAENYNSFSIQVHIGRNCSDGWYNTDPNLPRCCQGWEWYDLMTANDQKYRKIQLYFTNFQVIPQKPDYINSFLDDRVYMYMNEVNGVEAQIWVSDYSVTTDQGIFFLEYPEEQNGFLVDEQGANFRYSINREDWEKKYGHFQFDKSITSKVYSRSYEKIQDVVSVMGGLIGILVMSLFLVKSYNDSSYAISLGAELFKSNKIKEQGFFKKHTFLSYLKRILHDFLKSIGINLKWQAAVEYNKCEKEVTKCVDVLYLIKRIIFVEHATSLLLEKHQQTGLHLRKKLSLEEAYKKRQFDSFKKKIDKIRESDFLQKDFLALASQSQQGSNLEMRDADENTTAVGFRDSMKKMSDFYLLMRKFEQEHKDELEDDEDHGKRISHKRKRQIEGEMLRDLVKVQHDAKPTNRRISKRIMKLSGNMMSSILPESQQDKNQNNCKSPVKDFITAMAFKENKAAQNEANEIIPQNNNEPKQMVEQPTQSGSKGLKSIWNSVKRTIKGLDMFPATQFFQFQQELDHKTALGGLVSIIIYGVLGFMFYQKFMDCIQKNNIDSNETRVFSSDPLYMEISTYPKGNFMASIELNDLSLCDDFRYLDFSLRNTISRLNESTGEYEDEVTEYELQKCTLEHWGSDPALIESINNTRYNETLCFPKGITLSIQGRKSSTELRYVELLVSSCADQKDPNRPCDIMSVISYYMTHSIKEFTFRISNTVLNPKNKVSVQPFLDQRATLLLSLEASTTLTAYLDDYIVTTDNSIFPFWSDKTSQTGIMLTQTPIVTTLSGRSQIYNRIKIFRSFNTMTYDISFQKIQDIFAFIGGIFGILMSCLFIVKSYNLSVYEIQLCSKLFKALNNKNNILKKYTILTFFELALYNFLTLIKCSPKWKVTIETIKFQEEMKKELDIMEILKKIDFLECSILSILENHEVIGLRLKEKLTLDEAEQKNKAFRVKKKVYKMLQNGNNEIENQIYNNLGAEESFNSPSGIIEGGSKSPFGLLGNLSRIALNQKENFGENFDNFSEYSSDSEDEEEKEDEKLRIIEEILRLQGEARDGNEVSRKILGMANRNVVEMMGRKFCKYEKMHGNENRKGGKMNNSFNVVELNNSELFTDEAVLEPKKEVNE